MIVRCPACKKAATWEENPFRPFCSERCRLIDLGKWASEEYRIAGQDRLSENGDEEEKK
ncbi:MAG: DNA gyrase inhibitor YacG [Nitrospirota bacterium]|nr:DNA gyrase inhibitor YacG [Nitrospirota bacterium]